jgi:ABC-2 type transport system permease protein
MASIFVLAFNDLKLLWRDKFGLFWVLAFPLLIALLFGSIFSGGGDTAGAIKVAVADEDSTSGSQSFIDQLNESEALTILPMTREEAIEKVRKGSVTAYIIIEKGFGESGGFFFGESPPIEIGMDPSRRAEAGYLRGLLTQAAFQQMQKRFMNPDTMLNVVRNERQSLAGNMDTTSEQGKLLMNYLKDTENFLGNVDSGFYSQGGPLQMEGPEIKPVEVSREGRPATAFEITFPSGILWGLIGCAAAFGISIVRERREGTYLRLRLAPITRTHILAGKGMACFIACISVCVLLLLFGGLVFGVRLGNTLHLALAIIASAWCFVGIMMFISVLGKTEQSVSGAGWAVLLVMSMFGGGMVPLMFMPSWMRMLSNFSPVKWGIISLEGAIWRGFSLQEMMLPVAVLCGTGLVLFFIGVTILTKTDT